MRTTTALVALAVAVALAVTTCGGSPPKAAPATATAAPAVHVTSSTASIGVAHSYADVQSLLAAMYYSCCFTLSARVLLVP
jgi:hypothetical protein